MLTKSKCNNFAAGVWIDWWSLTPRRIDRSQGNISKFYFFVTLMNRKYALTESVKLWTVLLVYSLALNKRLRAGGGVKVLLVIGCGGVQV